jgi:hypothetical protein
LIRPASVPAARQITTPPRVAAGEPVSRWLARQLTRVITAPTERSRPPASTGTVCAIATITRAKLSFAFWISTAVEKPLGWNRLYAP